MSSVLPDVIAVVVVVIVLFMGVSITYIAINAAHSSDLCDPQEFTELKMSTISLIKYPIPFVNIQDTVVDEDGITYIIYDNRNMYKQFDGHNVTFAYNCYNGQKAITGILMDNEKEFDFFGCGQSRMCWECKYKASLKWELTRKEGCEEYPDAIIDNVTYLANWTYPPGVVHEYNDLT